MEKERERERERKINNNHIIAWRQGKNGILREKRNSNYF